MNRALLAACLLCAGCGARTGILLGDSGAPPARDAGRARDAGAGTDLGGDDLGVDVDAGPVPCDLLPACGGSPCTSYIDDQEVFALPESTNDVPTIGLDERGEPAILVPATMGSRYVGFLVRRDASGAWGALALTPDAATGAIAVGGHGPLTIEAYDGAFGNALIAERGGALVPLSPVPTDTVVQAGGVVRDGDGTLHMVGQATTGRDSYAGPTYVRRHPAGAFDSQTLPDMPMGTRGAVIAVDGLTTPWIVWRGRTGGPTAQILEAWSETGDVETIATVTTRDGDSQAVRVAAAGATIWAAYVDGTSSLRLQRRDGAGAWHSIASAPAHAAECGAAGPCSPIVPLGVLADCDGSAQSFFASPPTTDGDSHSLSMVSSDGSFATAIFGVPPGGAPGIAVLGGTVVRDDAGDVHVAYLVQDELRRDHVRYGRWTAGP